MRKFACAVCFEELPRAQRTCGRGGCLDSWRHYSDATKTKHINLASCTPSERALILSQGPSPEELEAQATTQAVLEEELDQYHEQQKKKEVPQFLRSMLDPANAPIKE